MPIATMPASRLRLKPRSEAMGRKNGPMLMRRPTVNNVRMDAAATMFQPKYQRPAGVMLCLRACAAVCSGFAQAYCQGSDVEQEVQHVTVLHHVFLALRPHLAGFLGALFTLE